MGRIVKRIREGFRRNLLWAILQATATVAVGCGPALTEQVKLRSLADAAATSCKATPAKCAVALVCARAGQIAASDIQAAQVARSQGQPDAGKEAAAVGSYAAALASCAAGGWK